MWLLMQKRSLQFAVFAWIAICMRCISCLNGLSIRSNGPGYPCKENLHPFKWLMQKNLSSVRTAWAVCSKKLSPVWKKLLTVQATGAICSKINLSRVSISQDNFVASYSRRMRYSWVVTLRSLVTNALWTVAYLFLLLYSHLRFHYYHSTIASINTQFIQYLSFFHFNKFPKNNVG